jgi:hypothetical protein
MKSPRMLEIEARRNELTAAADARREQAGPDMRGLLPTAHDWMTPAERWEDHALALEAVALERGWWGIPAERIALKRQLRAAGATFELDAPIRVLREILDNSACVGTKHGS